MIRTLRIIVRHRISQAAVAGLAIIATAGTASAQYGPNPSQNPYAHQTQQPNPYGQQPNHGSNTYDPYSQQSGYQQQPDLNNQPGYGQVVPTREQIDAEIQQVTVPQLRTASDQELMQGLQELQLVAQQVQQAKQQIQGTNDPRAREVELAEYAVNRLTAAIHHELQTRQIRNSTPPHQTTPENNWQPIPHNNPPATEGINPFDNSGNVTPVSNNPFDR